jgi:hypothetical protein|tara:strand:- start:104 stop:481 length:378 start_codon:yes stop_codon:yes gene_type:complete
MLEKIKLMKLGLMTLFISSSTLICCALPALFVAVGAGATLASLTNVFPQLIIISQYKVLISSITLIILLVAGVIIKKSEAMPCPVDPNLRTICLKTRKNSKTLYYLSVIIFASASVFTYLVPLYL